MAIFEYIFKNPNKSMTEIVAGAGVSRLDFEICIDVLEGAELVRGGYVRCGKDASSKGRPDLPGDGYICVYKLGKEMTLEDAQKILREKLKD
jgi:predicted transcriptional regulator